ncbi:C4-dicarboxylate ABC transporter substrate-binding protein [Motiliproteus coralliicola]|uniref:C4-dicarboxylate ABC transporter substrate-binding protein n=1 Tax=Motiliproteus coralliicola TaxID=2283196 RepID=A0A369WCW7_9GAMM|nr:TRAP transporter substrate-binding protein DctP [Motiliproteus coralliicola]RDE19019.1 C4-dicarboxylate ABC transporter substrate-binding protein [Motiliproteus coralliicola]
MLKTLIQNPGVKQIAGSVALAATLMVPTYSHAADEVVLAHAMSNDHIFNPIADHFMASLAKNAPDAFEIKYHPGGDLGDWTSQFEQTIAGEIGMTMTFPATDFDPRLNISIMGMVADSWDDAVKIYGPGGSMVGTYNEIYAGLNMKLLAILPVDFGGIAIRKGMGKVPVNFPEDGAGLKVRVPPMQTAIKRFEYLGFNPVPMPFSELYTALQLGSVDGRTFGPPSEIWQMRDVLETYVFSRDYFEQGAFLVNLDWWNDLNPEQQQALQAAADDAASWAWQEAEQISEKLIADIKDYGINVVELDAAQQSKLRQIIQDKEWTWMEATVGKHLVEQIRATTAE